MIGVERRKPNDSWPLPLETGCLGIAQGGGDGKKGFTIASVANDGILFVP